jgi:hypothetical protein
MATTTKSVPKPVPPPPDFFKPFNEPASAANTDYPPVYPFNHVQQTESGHAFEMDDTPTRERIALTHRTGTFIEMHPNGDEVHKVYGNGFTIIVSNKNILIGGDCNIQINGNCNLEVMKDMNVQVGGDYTDNNSTQWWLGGGLLNLTRTNKGITLANANTTNN